ncbi:MAG: TetR/AcrR family transcriptional regulator [Candidatus Limimorpha sp.]
MKELNLERKIMVAAEQLFIEKGFNGTSTTDIAREAGCNQALIHYYFRTKEKLFQQIFYKKFNDIFHTITEPAFTSDSLTEKIEATVSAYFDIMQESPQLPILIINELLTKPKRMEFFKECIAKNETRAKIINVFNEHIINERQKGYIRNISTADLLLDIISLTVFTFISKPIIIGLFELDENQNQEYINHRKKEITTLIINGIRT